MPPLRDYAIMRDEPSCCYADARRRFEMLMPMMPMPLRRQLPRATLPARYAATRCHFFILRYEVT